MSTELAGVGMLAVESARSRAYLCAMDEAGLRPAHVVFLDLPSPAGGGAPSARPVPYFDNLTPALDRIQRAGIPHTVVRTAGLNTPEVAAAVKAAGVHTIIYSGPGGALVGAELLACARFLHVHPGLVPAFRGSTTVYFSLLVAGACGASAMFLAPEIDQGPVIAMRSYPPPADRTLIDYGYDPHIRADLLVRVLARYRDTGAFDTAPQEPGDAGAFYIMHPVLRHIAILSNRQERAS